MAEKHPLVRLARQTIESYVTQQVTIRPPAELTEEMKKRAGVFVSLHKDGELRGCIGTIEPVRSSVAEEIIANAISAATRDPRFYPVTREELPALEISVDVLTEPQSVASAVGLDPKVDGIIVESGRRRGLLLPDLEGVDTTEEQITICRRKAGIGPHEPVKLQTFRVIRYH